jgi:putative endonuclease
MDTRKRTGQQGEAMAADYFAAQGYTIIARNWRCPPIGELDIIMEKAGVLVFVEVRARRSRHFGSPEESVTPTKQARLIELAQAYLQENPTLHPIWRIDVAAVHFNGGQAIINHLENAVGW